LFIRALVYSKTNYSESFGGTTIGPGHVQLRLNLDSLDYPTAYGLSFYTAESFKSNEVRDFTSWVVIPPADLHILTDPKDTVIRQGEEHLVPAEMNSPYSNNVTSIKFHKGTHTAPTDCMCLRKGPRCSIDMFCRIVISV
jgi:hypothetical protein